jgi:hypothetical protein
MEAQKSTSEARCRWLYLRNSYVPGLLESRFESPLSSPRADKLLHFSPQRKCFSWDTLGAFSHKTGSGWARKYGN